MPTRLHPQSTSIAGVRLFRVDRSAGEQFGDTGLRIHIASTPPRPSDLEREQTQRRWAQMVNDNPRLYSGPLLSVVSIDEDAGIIHTRRDEFKRLAVQPHVKTGVQILSVTGVITARDKHSREHVLLGRRGRGTRIYGGMWELGPAGGIPPPHASLTTLHEADAARHLLEEAEEELGLTLDAARIKPVTLYIRDTIAHSDDLTFVVGHEEPGSMERLTTQLAQSRATHAWEYEETKWVAIQDIAAFDRTHAEEIIITTRAAFRGLGWVRAT
jgi:8-oxo-dGTP pyrophosphatase MutT (NUDIX family)